MSRDTRTSTAIWSLKRRRETIVWFAYSVEKRGRCLVLRIKRVEDLGS